MKKIKDITNLDLIGKQLKSKKVWSTIRPSMLEEATDILEDDYTIYVNLILKKNMAIAELYHINAPYGPMTKKDAEYIIDNAAITVAKDELELRYLVCLGEAGIFFHEVLVDFKRNLFYDIIVEDDPTKEYIKVLNTYDIF